MPPHKYEDLLELLRDLVDNEPSNVAVLDHLRELLTMSWPDWELYFDGEQDLLRIIQRVRAGTV
jgi:hypothetical protein